MKRIFPILVLLIYSCGLKPSAKGELDQVVVFADGEIWSACKNSLSTALERVIDTPQPETVVYLKPVAWEKFADSTIASNIIIMGTLDGKGQASEYVRRALDQTSRKGVENGLYWFFAKKDPWYSQQLLVILCASDAHELSSRIQFGAEELFKVMQESVMQRLEETLYASHENSKLAEDIKSKYGIHLRIQHDYQLIREDSSARFLRLRRSFPDRWLTLSWAQADTLTDSLMLAERLRLGKLFTDPVKIYPEYNRFLHYDEFFPGGRMLRGLWATQAPIGGGPFFTIAFPVKEQHRVYFIDGAVFAPDRNKIPLLQQLEVMARTVRIEN